MISYLINLLFGKKDPPKPEPSVKEKISTLLRGALVSVELDPSVYARPTMQGVPKVVSGIVTGIRDHEWGTTIEIRYYASKDSMEARTITVLDNEVTKLKIHVEGSHLA